MTTAVCVFAVGGVYKGGNTTVVTISALTLSLFVVVCLFFYSIAEVTNKIEVHTVEQCSRC